MYRRGLQSRDHDDGPHRLLKTQAFNSFHWSPASCFTYSLNATCRINLSSVFKNREKPKHLSAVRATSSTMSPRGQRNTLENRSGTLPIPPVRCGYSREADIPPPVSHTIKINHISPTGQLISSVTAPPFLLGVPCSTLLYPFIKADTHGPL